MQRASVRCPDSGVSVTQRRSKLGSRRHRRRHSNALVHSILRFVNRFDVRLLNGSFLFPIALPHIYKLTLKLIGPYSC